jgi:eukaryotic-like serine/threonine-protein kinase
MSSGELATLSGRYRLRHRVGSGMMSSVYLADDLVFERTVAIKVLAPEFTADDQMMARFRREAQAAAKLDHSAFLRMFDIVSDGDTTFIVMEYANGPSLAQVLQTDGERSVSFATDVAWEVAIALRYVHGLGIILRHLSPSSIYLAPRGVKLAHFGIKPFLEPNAETYMAP